MFLPFINRKNTGRKGEHQRVMFRSPLIGAGAHKYNRMPPTHLSREWMLAVTFPTKDKSQMLVGVFIQLERGFNVHKS